MVAPDTGTGLAQMSWVCPRRQGGQMGEVSRGLVVGIQQPKIPVQLQEKNGPGPRRPCHLVLNVSAEAATLSWSFIHSYWVLPTCSVSPYLDSCFHCYFRFFKHTGFFFFFNQHSKIVLFFFFPSEPADRCQRPAAVRLRVRGSCWAIPRRHCFPLCLYVSKGNCTAKAL